MVITLTPELESALNELARRQGIAPEALALEALRDCLIVLKKEAQPTDDWDRMIADMATDCGVSLSDSALSSDGLYE